MEDPFKKIKTIKKRYEKIWLEMDGVVGIGIGMMADGQHGLIVSVREESLIISRQIPDQIKGVPIEIRPTGEIKAL